MPRWCNDDNDDNNDDNCLREEIILALASSRMMDFVNLTAVIELLAILCEELRSVIMQHLRISIQKLIHKV